MVLAIGGNPLRRSNGYRAGCMADPRSRRILIRRATITTLLAALAAVSVLPGTARGGEHPPLDAPPVISRIALPRPPLVDPATVAPPRLTPDLRSALQARLDGIRKKYAIPGVSVALLFPDGTTWVGTSGVAEVAEKTAVKPDTAFAIASVTKTFTSALVMALSEEGTVVLDAPVQGYLPELGLDPAITVRQLLDHTSGLHDYFFHPRIDRRLLEDPARRWDEADALRYVGKPYFKPGRGFHYSNTNYLVLGLLAERVGKAPLADQWRTRFLEPLGLTDTYYQPTESPSGPVAHGYRFRSTATDARAIDLSDGGPIVPFTSVVTAAAGAGGIAASASDVVRWARALYAGKVLREDSVQAMVADVGLTERYQPGVPYGLGVQALEVGGRSTLGHSGRLLGFRSVVRWLPDQDVAIAVLTNQSRTDPGIIARALLKVALATQPRCCADVR